MVDEEIRRSPLDCAVQICNRDTVATEYGYSASEYLVVPIPLPLQGTFMGVTERELINRHAAPGGEKCTYSCRRCFFTEDTLPPKARVEVNALIASGDSSSECARKVRKILQKGRYSDSSGLELFPSR